MVKPLAALEQGLKVVSAGAVMWAMGTSKITTIPAMALGFLWAEFGILGRRRRLINSLVAAKVADASPKTCTDLLPEKDSWVIFPETETLAWLNQTISELWPKISEAIHDIAQQQVLDQMQANPALKSFELELDEFTLGRTSPTFSITLVDDRDSDQIRLNLDINWLGDPIIIIKAKILGLPVVASLKNFQLFGRMRIRLLLLPKIPIVAAVAAAFVEDPKIDFDLKLLGTEVTSGFTGSKVDEIVKNIVAGICVWPKQILVPIQGQVSDYPIMHVSPVGMLYIRLDCAELPKSNDWTTSLQDPYVKYFMAGNASQESTHLKSTNKPVWDNEPIRAFLICNVFLQKLDLEVWDEDRGSKDDLVGSCSVKVASLLLAGTFDSETMAPPDASKAFIKDSQYDLKRHMDRDSHRLKKVGSINFKSMFLPFRTNGSAGEEEKEKDEEAEEDKIEESCGPQSVTSIPMDWVINIPTCFSVTLHCCKNIRALDLDEVSKVDVCVRLVPNRNRPEKNVKFVKDFQPQTSPQRVKPQPPPTPEVETPASEEPPTGDAAKSPVTPPAWFPSWDMDFSFMHVWPEGFKLQLELCDVGGKKKEEKKSLGMYECDVSSLIERPQTIQIEDLEGSGGTIHFTVRWGDARMG